MPASPSPENYTLGKGNVYIAVFSGGAPGAFAHVGNCPDFQVTLNEEVLAHQSAMVGPREKDKEISLEVGYDLDFTLEEITKENLAKFFRATIVGAEIRGLQAVSNEYAVRFVSNNPHGPNYTTNFHKCTLKPSGPVRLISDEWSNLPFKGSGLSDRVNQPDSPWFTAGMTTTTTTTTTTTGTTTTGA